MISASVDATLGAFWNYEGVDLQRRGRKPVILRMEQLGVPTYDELVFVARRADLDQDVAVEGAPLPAGARARPRRRCRRTPRRARRADGGRPRARPRAPGGVDKGDAAGLLPRTPSEPFGWQDDDEWQRLRRLDVRQRPDQAAAARDGR